jgi:hypothetical protein
MENPFKGESLLDTTDNKEFVKSKDCYYAIKQLLLDYIPETTFPTYDEWTEMVDDDKLHDPTLLAFRPGVGGAGAAATSFAARVGADALKSAGINIGTADEILNSMRTKAESAIRNRVRETASNMFENLKDDGDGGTSKENYSGGTRYNPTGLSQTLKPIDTSFDTDITFQGQTRYWQDGQENSGPLFLKSGIPGIVHAGDDVNRDDQMWEFIQGPLTMEWNTYIAKKVTWTGRVKDLLTEVNINSYMNRCLSVCSVYYFWRSVIAFTNDPRNRNAGMDALRDRLTPDDYNNLYTHRS